ncbi:YitT family protein [Algivirga pacifica]|uniref:YitT family protein n=1 Tax=Algivirga pacifica TaxID=1162670 RepID=A0ABP9D1L8_9BACT
MKKPFALLSEYLQIALGIFLASFGLKAFLLPNGFLDGGVTGIAILLSKLTPYGISFWLLIISVPFLLLGWFSIARRVVVKSVISIVALAIMIHYENFEAMTEDRLLISIFGGLFLGAGIGLTIKNGAVLDGSEILGVVINDRFGISIGKVILLFNIILFSITAMVFSKEQAMYSIITYLVTGKVVDLMIEGFEDYIGLMIFSKDVAVLKEVIVERMGAGLTVYQNVEGYGHSGKKEGQQVIHTVINRIDIRRLSKVIDEVDEKAVVIEFDINNIKGGVLRKYLGS